MGATKPLDINRPCRLDIATGNEFRSRKGSNDILPASGMGDKGDDNWNERGDGFCELPTGFSVSSMKERECCALVEEQVSRCTHWFRGSMASLPFLDHSQSVRL